ncbi:hypothetical protein SDC9_136787 [bioreactor metagenome]|uniref:Uncharacterized protein n=1 Tax=bioreactor metagenome TaxID=1076179 RepID=A0A645DK82_9ZZZZ
MQRLRIEREQTDRGGALILRGKIYLAVKPLDDLARIELRLLAEQIAKERDLRLVEVHLEPFLCACQRVNAGERDADAPLVRFCEEVRGDLIICALLKEFVVARVGDKQITAV